MIFAGIDVTLQLNHRAVEAGPDMYLWTWCMLWMRDQKKDGVVPKDTALACPWGGPIAGRLKKNAAAARALVRAGLWIEVEGGWEVFNYRKKNDTKEVIEARIEASKQRQEDYKRRKRNASPHPPRNASPTPPENASPRRVTAGAGAGEVLKPLDDSSEIASSVPPRPVTDVGIMGQEGHRWTLGMAEGGVKVVPPDWRGSQALAAIADVHSGLRGPAAGDWIQSEAKAFALATAWNPTLWTRTVKRFGEWITAGRPVQPDEKNSETRIRVVAEARADMGYAKPPPELRIDVARERREAVPVPDLMAVFAAPARPEPSVPRLPVQNDHDPARPIQSDPRATERGPAKAASWGAS